MLRRRGSATWIGLWGGMLLLASGVVASARAQGVEVDSIRIEVLAPGIAMLIAPTGGNVVVSTGPDGVFLVDDQLVRISGTIREAVSGLSDQPIRFVVNTHWHADHTGGNLGAARLGAVIVAHDNVRRRMSSEQFSAAFGRTTPASPSEALPIVTFSKGVRLHLNGQTIHVEAVEPAHTDGDALVFFEEADVVHMGDTYFNGIYPYIDVSSGGRPAGMIAAIDRVLASTGANSKIIPGHGPASNRRELEAYRAMLSGVATAVAELKAQGSSRLEVVAAKPTARWDAEWGDGFLPPDRFTAILYDALP